MGKEINWITADDCLIAEQKKALTACYNRADTNPPVIPVIPKREGTYVNKREEQARRTALAGVEIMGQAFKVFKSSEYDQILKMRTSCDWRTFNRVNFHWRRAMGDWHTFGINQWKTKEGIPLKLHKAY
jgi:hypothetical protein